MYLDIDRSTIMAKFMLVLGVVLATAFMARTALGSDPDLTTDFNVTNPIADSFTLRGLGTAPPGSPGVVTPHLATFANLLGLNGLGLSAVLFEFGAQSQIDPHYHPRGTELFYVLTGTIGLGFADTDNILFETTVHAGDLFVFPKGMLHWQRNNADTPASGFSVISSENPGTIAVAEALFTSSQIGFPEAVLTTAFASVNNEIDTLRTSVAKRNNITLLSNAGGVEGN